MTSEEGNNYLIKLKNEGNAEEKIKEIFLSKDLDFASIKQISMIASQKKVKTIGYEEFIDKLKDSESVDFNEEISKIAATNNVYVKHIENRVKDILLDSISKEANINKIVNSLLENSSPQITKLTKTILRNRLKSDIPFSINNGFINNEFVDGVKLANDGDAAEKLFISRAILKGFNTSQVEIRSSRYDAVIETPDGLKRIQIKGYGEAAFGLKDRDRGGQGIDTSHITNKGKFLSKDEVDFLVSVEKRNGHCYIIPIDIAMEFKEKGKKSIPKSEVVKYKENWKAFK